jgi:hypothetical protein
MVTEIKTTRIRWRWGIGAAIAMMLIALFPQLHFIAHRGSQWHGANAITHPDEVAYSAYVASLIRNSPRRYDPYTGRGQQIDDNSPESLFSIQFVPAYFVSLPARWLGLSTSTLFMILPAVCALVSSLILFYFIWSLTRDERFSAMAVLVVLSFGTLFAGQGIIRHVLNLNYLIPMWISNSVASTSLYHLPFLRLYQPAVAFPLFFLFTALVWLAFTRPRKSYLTALGAGLAFSLLVFSYFYLWTTALAWIICLCALWLFARRAERKRTTIISAIILGCSGAALIPYFVMLRHRAPTVDAAQALVFTHRPDLFRLPEFAAALSVVLLLIGIRRKLFLRREANVLIALSFALTIFIVFNQQVITGRSLQPVHFEWFIANYCALISVMLTAGLWWRSGTHPALTNKRLAIISMAALLWAFGEVWLAASVGFDYNRAIDDAKPAFDRLAQLSGSQAQQVVLVDDLKLADRLPTDAPQSVLWAPRMLVFPGVSEVENRERFWQQLYYLGYDEKRFWTQLDQADWNFLTGMFPYNRLSPVVSGSNAPITPEELRAQLTAYLNYARTFNQERAASPTLSYLVVHRDNQYDFVNLDRWYQRDAGERVGDFVVYHLTLRE